MKIKRHGGTKEDFDEAINEDEDAARHVADQSDRQRAIDRAWDRAPGPKDDVTEWSVAEAFRELYEGMLLHNHDTGQWHVWDETHWRPERTQLAFNFAAVACAEATAENKSARAKSMLRASSARGVEAFARADRVFVATSDRFDQDPFLLGTPTGTVDLLTGALRPARQGDYITKLTAVGPGEHCPLWLKFLNEATGSDAEMVRFLQQWFGYCLTGDTSAEETPVHAWAGRKRQGHHGGDDRLRPWRLLPQHPPRRA